MYNSGPLWVNFRRTMVVGVDELQSGSLCYGCCQEGGGAQGGAQGDHYHIGEDVHV